MLQLRRLSLSRQSNPSILTAGLLERRNPGFREDEGEEEDGIPELGVGIIDCGEIGENLSSPNRASWGNGLETLLGGDPQKKGGDEAACVHVRSDEP